jgi:hypothetical protein
MIYFILIYFLTGLLNIVILPLNYLYVSLCFDGYELDPIVYEVFMESFTLKRILQDLPIYLIVGPFGILALVVWGIMSTFYGLFELWCRFIDNLQLK